ncbi:unnamed protein product [Echinostoma caproni]|uniref:Ig-like domain-containing protein n=1 Tax=Echinostoma caproni TaxID=27848 RepID=A0A183A8C6_9TREM|nr:unnamed protein product [Echinostoma caproni]
MLHICPRGQLVAPGLLVFIRSYQLPIFILLLAVQTVNTESTEVRLSWTVKPGDAVLSVDHEPRSKGIPEQRVSGLVGNIQSDGPQPSSDSRIQQVEPGMQLQLECNINDPTEREKTAFEHPAPIAVSDPITNAPYIESLTVSQNPVATGSTVRLTCTVAPTPESYGLSRGNASGKSSTRHRNDVVLRFAWHRLSKQRLHKGTERSQIVSRVEQPNAFTSAVEVRDLRYDEGTLFECTVMDRRGRRAVRQIQLDVHYTPKSLRIETVPSHERPIPVDTRCHIMCSAEASNPVPTFNLLRQRLGQSQAHLMDGVTVGGVIPGPGNVVKQAFGLQLTEQDNGATFFCEVSTHGIMQSVARSDGRQFNVTLRTGERESKARKCSRL